MFRLPVSTAKKAVDIEVQRKVTMLHQQVSERQRLHELAHELHVHDPTDPMCSICTQAKMHKGDGVRGPLQPKQQLEVGFDLIGPLVKSNDGNHYKLVAVETGTGAGWSVGLPDKKDATVLRGVQACLAKLRLMFKMRDDVTVRFHSDKDASFMGVVEAYAQERAWLKTTTEGYDSNQNSRVERRNEKLAAGLRSMLLGATGGRMYYEELWDVGMTHMADMINHMPEAGCHTPAMRAGGEELVVEDMMEVFGAQVHYYEAPERRQAGSKQVDTRGKLGVWVGRSHTINGGHRIVPIEWSTKKQQWLLEPTIDRSYVVVDNTVYPLRKVPASDSDPARFEDFVNKTSPAAMVPDVYVVDKITDMRVKQGAVEYKVKWRGYSSRQSTWEPEAHLVEGAQDAVADYRAKHPEKVGGVILTYMVMHIAEATEDEKAVEQLMRQHKLSGSISDWLPAYKSELQGVIGGRCRELHGEEYIQAMKNKKVVMLRMNPEPKKLGGKKCRLIVKGFMEPIEWSGKTDSPTAMAATIKMLVAMGIDEQDMDIVVVDDDVVSSGDIRSAFLQADDYGMGEVYRIVGYKAHKGAKLRLFQLLGPLYGQRDAGYKWWESLSKWLISIGFVRSDNDKCVFAHPITRMKLAIHVDDILARGSRKQTKLFWELMGTRFGLKHWDIVEYDNPVVFTGYAISKVKRSGQVWYTMDMVTDIEAFLAEVGVDGSRTTTAPMPYKGELTQDPEGVSEQEHKWFRSTLGSLNWYTNARYDIAYEVARIAQYSAKPTKGAMKALRRLLAYMSTTRYRQLAVPRVYGNTWHVFSDSDHAGEMAVGDTRSHTGVMILLNGMPVKWRSNKQPKTALSSAVAEIYAMSAAVKDAKLSMNVAEEMLVNVTWPFKLYVDNAAGESFQHSTCPSTKMLGVFNLHDKWVRELKNEGKVWAVHVPTDQNLADMMTKGLTADVRGKLDKALINIVEKVATDQKIKKVKSSDVTSKKVVGPSKRMVGLTVKTNRESVKLSPAI